MGQLSSAVGDENISDLFGMFEVTGLNESSMRMLTICMQNDLVIY